MGMILQIAAEGRKVNTGYNPEPKEITKMWQEVFDAVVSELPENEKERMSELFDQMITTKHIRNFGAAGAKELMVQIGILLASMNEKDWEIFLCNLRRRG